MVVMIPYADFSDITVGMSVRVAGTFRMYRRRMVVDARQCRVVR